MNGLKWTGKWVAVFSKLIIKLYFRVNTYEITAFYNVIDFLQAHVDFRKVLNVAFSRP